MEDLSFKNKACNYAEFLLKLASVFCVCKPKISIGDRGGAVMAKCDVCGKGVSFGIAVSHSHRRNNRAWKANVRTVRVKTPGGAKTMHVCASCLRSNRVERA